MARPHACRQTESAERPRFRTYKDMPGSYLREAFIAHIRATGTPESFPGIHPGPIDKAEPFCKLTDFSIDRGRRPGGDMAFCPMCHQLNKILQGSLIYLTRIRAVAAIGHECAVRENRAAAEKDYRARRDRETWEDYLIGSLPHVAAKLAAINVVRPAADEATRVVRRLQKDAPGAVRQLRETNRTHGGQLIIAETIDATIARIGPSGFQGANGRQTRDIMFGLLIGTTAIITNYNPARELDQIGAILEKCPMCTTEEEALEAVCQLTEKDCKWTATNLRETDRSFRRFQSRIADFCSFFTTDNIARIDAWTRHPEHPSPFRITRRQEFGSVTLSISGYEDRLKVSVAPVIEDYRAEWPFAGG